MRSSPTPRSRVPLAAPLLWRARQVGSHLVMMDEGRVVEEGSAAEIFANPQNQRTRDFFSKIL